MVSELLFINLPYNCSDRELKEWIESRGVEVDSVRIIHDVIAKVSPAFGYAGLRDPASLGKAACILDGKWMRDRVITVKLVATRPLTVFQPFNPQRSA